MNRTLWLGKDPRCPRLLKTDDDIKKERIIAGALFVCSIISCQSQPLRTITPLHTDPYHHAAVLFNFPTSSASSKNHSQ